MKILIDAHMVGGEGTGIARYFSCLGEAVVKVEGKAKVVYYSENINGLQRIFWGFQSSIGKNKPDIIHVSNFAPYFPTVPIVTTVHDLCFLRYPADLSLKSRLAFRFFFQRPLYLSNAIICVSESVKKDLVKYYGIDIKKVTVVHEAPAPLFKPLKNKATLKAKLQQKFGLPEDFFLVVGEIRKRKRPEEIIEAFQRSKLNKPIQLVFAGPNRMGRKINTGKVKFLDYVTDEELLWLYNSSLALIFYSDYEGFGLPLVEAMACKTPIICSDIPVFREIAGHAAVFVKNRHELSRAIADFVTSKSLRNKYAELAFRRGKAFSWEKAAKETLAVYRKVLVNNSSSPRP